MNMKHLMIMVLAVTNATFAGYLTTDAEGYTPQVYGQTFLFTRPAFNNIAFEMNYWYDAWFDDKKKIAWEISDIYQSTTHGQHMAQTFFPPRKSKSLLIRGSTNPNTTPAADVLADWLYLPTNFEGTLIIKPEQWQNATVVKARYCLGEISEYSFFNSWWLYATLPLVVVQNKLNFEQKDVTNAGSTTNPAVFDIITAFENPEWEAFKFWTGTKKKVALGECRLGLGKTFIHTERAHLASYSAVSIPTAKKGSNEFIFEPQPGFDGHWALINGVSLQTPITRDTDFHYVCFFIELELTSMFRNHQYRVLSLQNNPWSYFMQYQQKGQKPIPGINLLNKWVRVSSYEILDWAAGFRFGRGVLQGEIGFGMWVNSQERIKLADDWDPFYAIPGSTLTTSSSLSTISAKAPNNPEEFITIPVTQLDCVDLPQYSRSTILYRVNVSLGADMKKEKLDLFFGIGSFFESPSSLGHSSIFQQWGVWVKCGGAF